jgi:peptidoglycan hydrolase-like protein with peptidoglycan-binding domain
MRKTATAVASLLIVAAGGTVIWLATRPKSASGEKAVHAIAATAKVTQQDLTIYDTTTATLGFTTSVTVSSPASGTVTSLLPVGSKVGAGTVVATIDGAPVVSMFGDVPSYRDLSVGVTAGIDVRQLENNLVLLGFDPDHQITLDMTYDKYTAAAVTRWENSIGLTGDGKVTKGEVVFIPGELLADTASVAVGASVNSGGALIQGRETSRSLLVSTTGGVGGVISNIAAPGTPVTTGTVLYLQNGFPVVAIEGDSSTTPTLGRTLKKGVSDGVDVKMLKQMLVTAGFDPNTTITIDDHFDDATVAAVQAWWAKSGVPAATAVAVPAGSFVVVPGGLFVGTPSTAEGATVTRDSVILSLTTSARQVTTSAPVGDTTFVVGASIDVLFPDGTDTTGKVVTVGNVASTSSNTPGATPTVPITLDVAKVPATYDSFVQIPVTLRVINQQEKAAFVVPVSALVALQEGGYALEVVDGKKADGTTASHLIGVKPGIYSKGFVSITGSKVAEGLEVVVPS